MATTDIDEVLSRLDAVVARAIADGDRSGYFAVLYRKVTAKVKEGIEAGFFDDAERMGRLDALFAERYFDAVAARDAGEDATASWQLTFEAAHQRRPLVLQHLLVGINAHINLDLGIAAARCSPGDQLPALRRDFDRINAVLASVIGVIQDDLRRISPWLGLLDRFGARTQTELVRFSIVTARAGAWRFATDLAATPESRWTTSIEERDRRVARVGERVLRPGALMGAGLLLVRLRERQDVAADLSLLLDAAEPSLDLIATNVDEPTVDG
jgi:hypothetical protein